jgi:hypothetical protein
MFEELPIALLIVPFLATYAVFIAKQVIREKLVARLLEFREYSVDISSDWTISPRIGYARALKHSTIWGADSKAMLKIPGLRKYICAARAASVLENICMVVILLWLGLAYFAYSAK